MAVLEIKFVGQDGVGSIVNNITAEMHQLNETTNHAKESGTGFFSNMLSSAGGFLAANIIGGITSQVSNFVGSIGTVMSAEQDQMAQLQAGLASTGGKAGVTIDMMTQLADAQAKQTKFSVSQTEAIEKVGLTFTSINKDVFPQTVSLAEDMSARLGIQGSAAMTMLGKAMDDPLKGMAALHRVGVSFTDEQKNQVKALLAVGDTMGAQKIILAELGTEYGGSAVAAGKTFSGQQEIINHQMDELKVKIGTAVMPIMGQLMGFMSTSMIPIFEKFTDWFVANLPPAMDYVSKTVVPNLLGAWKAIAPVFDTVQSVIQAVADEFAYFLDLDPGAWGSDWSGTIDEVVTLISTVLGPAITSIGGFFAGVGGPVQDAISDFVNLRDTIKDNGFPQLGVVIATTAATMRQVLTDLMGVWSALQPVIANVTNAVQAVVLAVFGQIQAFLHAHGADIAATMQDAWTRIMAIIKLGIELYNAIVPPVLRFIAQFITAHGKEIQAILSNTWSSIKAVIDAALTLIEGVIKVALDLIHGNWSQAWEDLKQMSARIVLDLWTIIKNGLDNVVTIFGGTWTKIRDGVGQFITVTIPGLASSIIDGLVTGIENGSSALANAIWSMIKGAVSSAIANLGGGGGGSGNTSARAQSVGGGAAASTSTNTSMRATVNIYPHPAQSTQQVAATTIKQMNRNFTLRRA